MKKQFSRRTPALFALSAAALLLCQCESSPTVTTLPKQRDDAKKAASTVTITIAYGSEKKTWLEGEAARFMQSAPETTSHRRIVIDARPMGSGEAVQAIKAGTLAPHVFSPASSVYLEMLDTPEARVKGEALVLSPLVVAMWQPMAEALGWPSKAISWNDFLSVATDARGWSAYGHSEWGRFKLAHTHPEFSNSGFLATLAEIYAGAKKTRDLQAADLDAPATRAFLERVEGTVVYYGKSTGFFMDKMIARGPGFLSGAIVYENLVVESYAKKTADLPPLVAVYPKEGTFWADHPYAILCDRGKPGCPAFPADERDAAQKFSAHLRSREAQERALALGFRPADTKIATTAPIDAAHGVDPKQPQTILPLPPPEVVDRVASTWAATKKGADVAIVFDKSGSMAGRPLAEAKAGAKSFLETLGDRDEVTFVPFDDVVHAPRGPFPLTSGRKTLANDLTMISAGGGTALYDAIRQAYDAALVRSEKTPGVIHAVVVMTDGKDEGSKTTLPALKLKLRARRSSESAGDAPVKVFTIAYGAEAEGKVLAEIADAAGGWSGRGSVETIRDVYVEVASFF
jgi:Ca-activated chloride channel homolog